jgi:parallel beta-helix repeat protein
VKVENIRIEAFSYGIFVDSGSNHEICGNNIANTVDAIFLQSSSNDSLSGNSITTNSGWGVVFFVSHNETLIRNNIKGNHDGVWLAPSSNNSISENNIVNNTGDGIALYSVYYDGTFNSSSSNSINHNNITDNGADGIKLLASSNYNTISANNLIENQLAIELNYSTHNTIYNNNFMSNTQQVLCTPGFPNTWDNGYPSGGNHWNDYTGVDFDNGVFQNQTGSDGIGDSQYTPAFQNIDHYPLMGMFNSYNVTYYTPPITSHACNVSVISNSTISGFVAPIWIEHPNVIFLQFNVSGAEGSNGFCRVAFPIAMMNGTYHVFLDGTEIPCTLLSCSDINTTYLYFNYTHSTQEVMVIPEFPSFLILPLFFMATLLAVITYRRKHR